MRHPRIRLRRFDMKQCRGGTIICRVAVALFTVLLLYWRRLDLWYVRNNREKVTWFGINGTFKTVLVPQRFTVHLQLELSSRARASRAKNNEHPVIVCTLPLALRGFAPECTRRRVPESDRFVGIL